MPGTVCPIVCVDMQGWLVVRGWKWWKTSQRRNKRSWISIASATTVLIVLVPNNDKGDEEGNNNMMKQQQLKIANESIFEDRDSGVGCLLLLLLVVVDISSLR